jgi:hypothetical protein
MAILNPAHVYNPEADDPLIAPFATAFLRMMFAHAKLERRIRELQGVITGDEGYGAQRKNQWGTRDRPKRMTQLIRDKLGEVAEIEAISSRLQLAIEPSEFRNWLAHGEWWLFAPETKSMTVCAGTAWEPNGSPEHLDVTAADIDRAATVFDDLEAELWKCQSEIEERPKRSSDKEEEDDLSNTRAYFEACVRPLRERFQADDSPASLWAAMVSLHHVADYYIRDTEKPVDRNSHTAETLKFARSNPVLADLGVVADAFKHSVKETKKEGQLARADSVNKDAGILALDDFLSNSNFLGSVPTMTIRGKGVKLCGPFLIEHLTFGPPNCADDLRLRHITFARRLTLRRRLRCRRTRASREFESAMGRICRT